jgi:hypothetical protein
MMAVVDRLESVALGALVGLCICWVVTSCYYRWRERRAARRGLFP